MKFDPPTMRARFHEAKAEKEAAEAALAPKIAERDAVLAEMAPLQAKLKTLNEGIKAEREPIYELSVEMGSIAKFLRGPDGKARL